jgi:hypothetical protein
MKVGIIGATGVPEMPRPRRNRRRPQQQRPAAPVAAREAWVVSFYETSGGAAPALDFLKECPTPVRQRLLAIVVAVRDGPSFSFPPSNMWHVMRDDMKGFHEARMSMTALSTASSLALTGTP